MNDLSPGIGKDKKIVIFENVCKIFDNFPKLIPSFLERKYVEAIVFAHINVNPNSAFLFSVILSISLLVFPSIILYFLNYLSVPLFLTFLFLASYSLYYFLNFPLSYATEFRVKATSEMILCVNYMVISLRISPNLENAIKFASENLRSALGYDLKMILWGIYSGKYFSVQEAFDQFINKWKRENEEFAESLTLLKSAVFKTAEEREKYLSNALRLVIDGSITRIKKYSRDLRAPIGAVNGLGILMPALGLVLTAVFSFFLPYQIPAFSLVLVFNLILPTVIFSLLNSLLLKRPFSFPVPDISMHPKFRKENIFLKVFISLIPSLIILPYSAFYLSTIKENFFLELIYSSLIVLSIAFSIIIFCFLTAYPKLKLRNEIEAIEEEFPDSLYQLSFQLEKGLPIENAIELTLPRIKTLQIRGFLNRVRNNILTFGMTFENAILDKKVGAIYFFPSKLLESIMRMISSIMKRGIREVASSMKTVSKYLLDMRDVIENFKDILNESTAEMTIQKYLLFPIVTSVIVGIIAMIFNIFHILGNLSEKFIQGLDLPSQTAELVGENIMKGFLNLSNQIPLYQMQIIIGIYLIEMVFIISNTQIIITKGDDPILKRMDLLKSLTVSITIYFLGSILLFITFSGLASSIAIEVQAGQFG